jgi:hypothetical protein
MALRIVKAEEPIKVERINLCLYGVPGIGKSTTAFTAENPLLLDFDRGSYRAANRRDIVQITAWSDVSAMTQEDLAPYSTIVIDTAGRALDFLSTAIMNTDPKMRNRSGGLSLPGFGALKSQFGSWLKQLNMFGKDVILVAHMDEQKNGDDIIERLDVQGGSKAEIYKSVDAMGRLFVKGGKRVIDFSPREGSFGKNPAQLPELEIPNIADNPRFLAETIAKIKAHLNEFSEEQKVALKAIEEWSDAVDGYTKVEEFNKNLTAIKTAPKMAQKKFAEAAAAKGFDFDKKTNVYVEKVCA